MLNDLFYRESDPQNLMCMKAASNDAEEGDQSKLLPHAGGLTCQLLCVFCVPASASLLYFRRCSHYVSDLSTSYRDLHWQADAGR